MFNSFVFKTADQILFAFSSDETQFRVVSSNEGLEDEYLFIAVSLKFTPTEVELEDKEGNIKRVRRSHRFNPFVESLANLITSLNCK